jgi:putative ATP-dependent endonuclease of the OLD family
VVVLVEGIEDVAFISTHLHLIDKWTRFRELGCHIVIGNGKGSLSRPLAIAKELSIPAFVVFDSDADRTEDKVRRQNERDNSCILRLCGVTNFDPLPTDNLWHETVVMWKSELTKIVPEDFGNGDWTEAKEETCRQKGFTGISGKNSLLIAATLERLASQGKTSGVLAKLGDHILAFAEKATK